MVFCIAYGDNMFDARFAARTSDFCFGKSHQNHFAPSSHPTAKAHGDLAVGCPALLGRRGGFSTVRPCTAKNARLPGAPLTDLVLADLRCSVRLKGRHLNQKKPALNPKPKALVAWIFVLVVKAIDVTRPFWPAEHRRAARMRPAWVYHAGRAWEARVGRRTGCPVGQPPRRPRSAGDPTTQANFAWVVGRVSRGEWLWLLSPKGK